jgi:hypothetical protein
MSKQWGAGFHKGVADGFKSGDKLGSVVGQYKMANEMRVLFCALITAHTKKDDSAFWSTVEIAKATLNQHANFSDAEWDIFRGPAK